MEDCKEDLRTAVLNGRYLLREAEKLADLKGQKLSEVDGHDDESNPFIKWEMTIRAKAGPYKLNAVDP
jgi:hypothetical protein